MLHVAHPKIPMPTVVRRPGPWSTAAARTVARSARAESLAAPLTLAAVVLGALLLAVTFAISGALGA